MRAPRSPRGRRFGAPALAPVLLAGAALLIHLLPAAGRHLEYSRTAIESGQAWRLLTGHWTHVSLDHLAWDAIVFAVLGCALARRWPAKFWWTVAGSAAAISLTLFCLQPGWETYRGLSGIDAALFAALAALLWRESERPVERRLAACALLLPVVKIAFELATGTTLFTAATPGHEVVPLAHLVGLAAGSIAAFGSPVGGAVQPWIRGVVPRSGTTVKASQTGASATPTSRRLPVRGGVPPAPDLG